MQNIAGLILSMGIKYDAMEWRLFIDSSSRSLKTVLLYNGNSFSSIPSGHSVQMNERNNSMDNLLSAVNYHEHKWLNLWRPYGGWTGPRASRWVHKAFLFFVSLRQLGWRPTLCQTRMAIKTRIKTWLA